MTGPLEVLLSISIGTLSVGEPVIFLNPSVIEQEVCHFCIGSFCKNLPWLNFDNLDYIIIHFVCSSKLCFSVVDG